MRKAIICQHSTAQHSTAQHSTAQHSTAQHSTAQHSTTQHNTAVKTWLFSRLLDYNLTQKDICTYSIRYNECMNHIGGDAYG